MNLMDTTNQTYQDLCVILERYLNPISARSVLRAAMSRAGVSEGALNTAGVHAPFIQAIEQRLGGYNLSRSRCAELLQALKQLNSARQGDGTTARSVPAPERVQIHEEADVLVARRAAREMSMMLGFSHTAQIKITTAVSELSRNIFKYAKRGEVRLTALVEPSAGLKIEAIDQGPGIPNIQEILGGTYQSKTGMGLGIWGCKNLMDAFAITSSPLTGTHIEMKIYL
jgi:serine/threonine-protein kinase RsbT